MEPRRWYDFAIERDESLRSIRERLDTAGPAFLAHAREVIDGRRLDETFVDAICEPAQVFTYGGMLGHVLTFAAHRRTLAIGALHSAGITDLGPGDPMLIAEAAVAIRARTGRREVGLPDTGSGPRRRKSAAH